MDKIDKAIKRMLLKQKSSNQYNKMIEDTMNFISNDESYFNANQYVSNQKITPNSKSKTKLSKILKPVAAVFVIGILGVTTYAGVTYKLNLGNSAFKKVEENYNELASVIDKKFENEYFTLTLETMASDPAYLIFEYNLNFTDKTIEQVGEISCDEFQKYDFYIDNELIINDKKIDNYSMWKSVEKISDNQFTIVDIYNIANISDNILNVTQKINDLKIGQYFQPDLKVDINKEINAKITFTDNEKKILAETKLSNGSTLYIEEVANSKFANYVVARIITAPKTYQEMTDRNREFMIEDPQFAICDQDNNSINFDYRRLEEYYQKVSNDGTVLSEIEYLGEPEVKKSDLVRMQQVQLLRLAIDEENPPEKLKILPLNRKLYNDRNDSEYNFYINEDWYQVAKGNTNISEDSSIGGSVTITNVEETDDKIIFYYEKKGFVPSFIDFALRVKSPKMNYRFPLQEELKGIDGTDNKIIYSKDISRLSGLILLGYNEIENIDDLEFAMFYNTKYDVLSDPLEFNWNPNTSGQKGVIEIIE